MNILLLLHVLMDVFFCICLVWSWRSDYKKHEIPNKAVLLILIDSVAQLVLFLLNRQPVILYLATLLMFIPMYLWWRNGKMGGGDLKLFLVCGLYMGAVFFMGALLVTLIAAGIAGKTLKQRAPLAVFFAPGAISMIIIELFCMFIV
jgi:Flp pilus assembly protein protease CpaA